MMNYRGRRHTRAKKVIFALAAILCILIIIAVAFHVFGGKKQLEKDEKTSTDAAEFIVPDMTDQSDAEKAEETVTQTGTEEEANVKSTKDKKKTDSKNSNTANQNKKKNTTEQSGTVTPITPDKNGSSSENGNSGNETPGNDSQGNNNSTGREKNELEIIPSE